MSCVFDSQSKTYVRMYVCTYVCMYVCMYVYMCNKMRISDICMYVVKLMRKNYEMKGNEENIYNLCVHT